ncbi:MAG: hypothetical protein PHH85_13120 [Candidatus Methanoperedens sp.]|nr:hypothetical protein [Candidatus Methanoperedens sp.]
MTLRSLFNDDTAKVPFAVIGVLLLLISVMASISLVRMDVNMAKAMSVRGEISAPDNALLYAKADMARAIDYAGMSALKQLGETPVIIPDNGNAYFNGTEGNIVKFDHNRAKALIRHSLNKYIESNYRFDTFAIQGYSVNAEPLDSWDVIEIQTIRMKLNRTLIPPVMQPGENGYDTYWKVRVPLRIHLTELSSGTELTASNITIETLITARYPLLKDLTDEYGVRVNGSNAVMVETTAFSMAYTWARGYMQYYRNTPANIINNTHLSLMLNGALLLDQGFVFNSVDPMSIFEYSKQSAFVLAGKSMDYGNITLDNGSLKIDPQQDAFNSTGNSTQAQQDSEKAKQFDINATPITDYLNNGSSKSFASQKIWSIIPQVYSTALVTGVDRQTTETEGLHDGYESSHRVEGWGEPDSMSLIGTVAREDYVPGALYGEIWDVTWTRSHVWRHYYIVYYTCTKTKTVPCSGSDGKPSTCTIEYTTTCSRTEYNEMTTTDTRVDRVTITLKAQENSFTSIPLGFRGSALSSKNDVVKPYEERDVTYSAAHTDPQLEEAYVLYKSDVFDANKDKNLKSQGLSGDTDAETYSSDSPAPNFIAYPGWLTGEAQFAVDEITEDINRDVHLDPAINYVNYPVPSDLLVAARDDLIMKIARNESRYVDEDAYFDGALYSSTSAKVISLVRKWYVDEVKYQIYDKFTDGSDLINSSMGKNFSDPDSVVQANRDGAKLLAKGMYLPFGLTMRAYHTDDEGNVYPDEALEAWNESVTLGVFQEPDYLSPDIPYGAEKLYTLKLRNSNPTNPLLVSSFYGVPVLPTLDPWIMTFGAWEINVEGEFVKFEVFDGDDETHPNPIFGHEAQVYVREKDKVEDPITGFPIGDNLPIKFSFITGNFIAVPPSKLGVGDREGGYITTLGYVEESKGWEKT